MAGFAPCPRCGHLAYRHKSGQRMLHDLGNLSTGCPVDLLVTYSSHYCSRCQKYFNIDLSDLACQAVIILAVIQMAVRLVVEDGLLTAPPAGICGATTACLSPLPPCRIGRRLGEKRRKGRWTARF